MASITRDLNRRVGLLVDRAGRVEAVAVGDARRIPIPRQPSAPAGRDRFCTLRFLATRREDGPLTPNELAMLTVQTPTEDYVLIRQTGQWILEDDPTLNLNQELIQLFVSRVADLPAELPVRTDPTTSNEFGFATPSAVFTGKDVRGLDRGHLVLGKIEGGLIYAKGAGLPGVFQTRSLILTQIPSKQELIDSATSEE